MSNKCPNMASSAWKALLNFVKGDTIEAYRLWMENGEEIPDVTSQEDIQKSIKSLRNKKINPTLIWNKHKNFIENGTESTPGTYHVAVIPNSPEAKDLINIASEVLPIDDKDMIILTITSPIQQSKPATQAVLEFPAPKKKERDIAAVIVHKEELIKDLYHLKVNATPTKEAYIHSRIKTIEEEIAVLQKQRTLDVILTQGKQELEIATTLLNQSSLSLDDLENAIRDINTALLSIEFWNQDEVFKTLIGEDFIADPNLAPLVQRRLEELYNNATNLKRRAIALAQDAILGIVNKDMDIEATKEMLFGTLNEDISTQWEQIGHLAETGSKLAAVIDFYKRKADEQMRKEVEIRLKQIADNLAGLTTNDFSRFVRNDGKLVVRFSNKYFEELRKVKVKPKPGTPKAKIQRMWQNYFSWHKKNTITFDLRKIYLEDYNKIDKTKQFSEKDRQEHLTELKQQLGQKGFDYYMARIERKYAEYNRDRAMIEQDLRDQFGTDEAAISQELGNWELVYSPFIYSESREKNEIQMDGQGRIANPQGYKYTESIPRRFIDGKETGYYDSQFAAIENSPESLKQYEFILNTLHSLIGYLPDYVTQGLQMNTLPELKKSFVQSLIGKDSKFTISGLTSQIADYFLAEPEDIDPNDIMEKERRKQRKRTLKITMLSDKLSEQEKSKDLVKILQAFTVMAVTHRYKAEHADKLRITQTLANELKTVKGEVPVKLLSLIDHAVDNFYGVSKQHHVGTKRHYTKEEKESVQKIKAEMEEAEIDLANKKISQAAYDKKIKAYEDKLKELGRVTNWTALGDALLQYTQMKGMGWNVFAGITNAGFGVIANSIEANAGVHFDNKSNRKALAIFMKAFGKDKAKLAALMARFNILKDFNEEAAKYADNNNILEKGWKRLAPYYITKMAEFMAQGNTLGAVLYYKKVTDLSGKERSLFEAFNEDGTWNEAEFGNQGWDMSDEDILSGNISQKNLIFSNYMAGLCNQLHGNYDPLAQPRLKRKLMGRALMQFRSWMEAGMTQRFGKEDYNDLLRTEVKGRYRSYGAYFEANGGYIKGVISLAGKSIIRMVGVKTKVGGQMSEVDKANMQRNIAELSWILMLMGIALLLKYGFDDPDDEEKGVINYTLNVIGRLQADVMFYSNPAAFEKLTRGTLIPAISNTFVDITRIVGTTSTVLLGKDSNLREYLGGPEEDEIDGFPYSRAAKAWMNAFPGTVSISRLIQATQSVYNK